MTILTESNFEVTFIQDMKTFSQFTSETLQWLQHFIEDGQKLSENAGHLINDGDPKVIIYV